MQIKITRDELRKLLQAEHDVKLISNNLDKAMKLISDNEHNVPEKVYGILKTLKDELG